MAYDYQIETVCDHCVYWEEIWIDQDKRTLRLPLPIINTTTVQVKINELVVPFNNLQYGWTVQLDEYSVAPDQKHKIVFNKPVKTSADMFFVSYSVKPQFCRKCYGIKTLYDYMINSRGQTVKIEYEQKLIQYLQKLILSRIGSNPYHVWYGTHILDFLYQPVRNFDAIRTEMILDIIQALDKVKEIQSQQVNVQTLSPREMLLDVNMVDVQESDDKTWFALEVDCSTVAGSSISVERVLPTSKEIGILDTTIPLKSPVSFTPTGPI